MRGVPRRLDSGNTLTFDAGSRWSQPLYACASAIKATVKTTTFSYNGTDGVLSNLHVDKIVDKTYANHDSLPLWGVENTGNTYTMPQTNLIWGLVSASYENHPNVSTIRQQHLYLPGHYDPISYKSLGLLSSLGYENLPGSDFYSDAMAAAYYIPRETLGIVTDYSGQVQMATWTYWQTLSKTAASASLIPNLIFTDNAAAAVVGTKGILGPSNAATKSLIPVLVTPTTLSIRYHWPFAIPAFIVALLLLAITIITLITLVGYRYNLATVRQHINNVTPGRIYIAMLYPEQGDMRGKSKMWGRQVGDKMVDLSGKYPKRGSMTATSSTKV